MCWSLRELAPRRGVSACLSCAVAIALLMSVILLGGCSGSDRQADGHETVEERAPVGDEGPGEDADSGGEEGPGGDGVPEEGELPEADDEGVGDGEAGQTWQAAWTTSLFDYNESRLSGEDPDAPPFENVTLRQLAYLSAGGEEVRVLISNRFGTEPLTIARAHAAMSVDRVYTDAASGAALTFAGHSAVTLAPGEEIWSDAAPLAVEPQSTLAVDLYLEQPAPRSTFHALGWERSYVIQGDAVANPAPEHYYWTISYFFLGAIDVRGGSPGRTIVAFGDSITEGSNSTIGANLRYPDFLARRLAATPDLANVSVVNAGISGNRVLHDVIGPRALDRFDREVLERSGVSHAIIALGINDIGFGHDGWEKVSAEQIIAGLRTLLERARAAGVQPVIGTLAPFGGSRQYYSEEGEAARQRVNAWIRGQGLAPVLDFDVALRDPDAPVYLRGAFSAGDGIHPNDAGYEAMAEAIDLNLFR